MNYLILVNKSNPLDDSYYNEVEMIECKDIEDKIIKVEKRAYDAYLKLKEYMESKNIFIELVSAYRSIEEQQKIIDEFTIKYGLEYTNNYVAPIGTSEHHLGLALDLGLIVDGIKMIEDDDLFAHEVIYLEIHKYLSNYGFILRYPKGKESITGYNYEPWHIRYVGKEDAKEIYKENITLEEYLNSKTIKE